MAEQQPAPNIPIEIAELFVNFRENKMRPVERHTLFAWISQSLAKDPTFDYLEVARKSFAFDDERLVKLKRAVDKFVLADAALTPTKFAEKKLTEAERGDFSAFLQSFWDQTHDIARELVMQVANRAKEMGYYDRERKLVDVKSFVEDALKFFMENKDKIDDVIEERDHYQALSEVLREQLKPASAYLYLARLYTWFMVNVQVMQAQGYPVPEFMLEEIEKTFNQTYARVQAAVMVKQAKVSR